MDISKHWICYCRSLRWCLWRHGRVGFCFTAVSTCRSCLMHQGLMDIWWYLRIYKYCLLLCSFSGASMAIDHLISPWISHLSPLTFPLPPLPECCSRDLRRQSKMDRSERCWQLWTTLTMAQQIRTDPTTSPHKKLIWEACSWSGFNFCIQLASRAALVFESFAVHGRLRTCFKLCWARCWAGSLWCSQMTEAPKHASTWKVLNTAIRMMLAVSTSCGVDYAFNVCLLKLWLPEPASHTCQ